MPADQDFGYVFDGAQRRKHRYLDVDVLHLGRVERRKARVALGGGQGHLLDRVDQRPVAHEGADATAQLATLVESHEGTAVFAQPPGRCRGLLDHPVLELFRDRLAGQF